MKRAELIQSEKLDTKTALLRLTGDVAVRQAFIENAGNALRARYDHCESSFIRFLQVSNAQRHDDDVISPKIVIGRGIKEIDGHHYSGKWEAMVIGSYYTTMPDATIDRPIFKTTATFVSEDAIPLRYSSQPDVHESFGARSAFWGAEIEGWTEDILEEAVDDYEASISTAEETLGMLWTALADPTLNPGFATQALLVHAE